MIRRKSVRPPLQACLEAGTALQEGRDAVRRVFVYAAGEVTSEVDRARAVFKQAEDLLVTDGQQVFDAMSECRTASQDAFRTTSDATERCQSAAKTAMSAMLRKLNQMTETLAEASKQKPGGESGSR